MLTHDDYIVAGFKFYLESEQQMRDLYTNPDDWMLTALLNWEAKPCPLP